MSKLNRGGFFSLLVAVLLLAVLPAMAQQSAGNTQPLAQKQWSMQEMMQKMQKLINKSGNVMQMMNGNNGNGMMNGRQGMMPGMMMQGNRNWNSMVEGTDQIVQNMNRVMEQMQQLMQNTDLQDNQPLQRHLQQMQQNMGGMMRSMNSFLNNAQQIEHLEKTASRH